RYAPSPLSVNTSRPTITTVFPYTTLFRSLISPRQQADQRVRLLDFFANGRRQHIVQPAARRGLQVVTGQQLFNACRQRSIRVVEDRKSTRLNSSVISYAVFGLKNTIII